MCYFNEYHIIIIRVESNFSLYRRLSVIMLPIYATRALLKPDIYLFTFIVVCIVLCCIKKHILFNYYIIPFIIFVSVLSCIPVQCTMKL